MKKLLQVSFLTLCLIKAMSAFSAIEAVHFDTPAQEQRYQDLIAELRCLVCQNQNLADSNADLAKDLRRKTHEMILAGKSDKEILHYMQERYGDFVLYRPPFNLSTAILWVGPLLLLLITLIFLWRRIRHQSATNTQKPDATSLAKARDLLNRDD